MSTAPTDAKDQMDKRNNIEIPYELEMVPISQLFVDPKYQRDLTSLVKRMEAHFDPRMFPPLMVSERKNDRFAIFDGQHRYEAAKDLGYNEVPCLVYRGLTPQQESTLFARLQRERRNITAADRFRATLYGEPGDPDTQMAHDIEKIAEKVGFTVGSVTKEGKKPIPSPSALEQIYRSRTGVIEGDQALTMTLELIAGVWGEENHATNADLIKGIGLLFLRHSDKMDPDQLVSRMREVTPGIILGRASELRSGRGGGGAGYAVYRALVQQYNRGGGKRLQQQRSKPSGDQASSN